MPFLIDRYLLRQFIQVFLICFISLAGLYVVIDAFGQLDHFLDYSKQGGNLVAIMGRYYALRTLAFFDQTSGILALIAAMFTVTWIQRHNEMTALMAAGLPRLRVLRSVIIAAIVVSLAAAAVRELVIPNVRYELALDSKNLGGDAAIDLQPRYDNRTDILISGEKAVAKEKIIVEPVFSLPPALATYGRQLAADQAKYLPKEGQRPAGYLLQGVPSGNALLNQASQRLGEEVVIATPKDCNWLAPNELFVVSNVSFELLASGDTWRDHAAVTELVRELKNPSTELGPDVRVALHGRLLHPLLDTTLLFLGLPLVVARGNRNPYIAMGLCLAAVTGFFLVTLGAQQLGSSGWIRPALAAWLPLIVFVPVAVALSDGLKQ